MPRILAEVLAQSHLGNILELGKQIWACMVCTLMTLMSG